jgi:hypothetical protein
MLNSGKGVRLSPPNKVLATAVNAALPVANPLKGFEREEIHECQ